MSDKPDRRPPRRVREPVQVYLDSADLERLERLLGLLRSNKSDVLRRGLRALERELTDPADHPALRIIGIADSSGDRASPAYDVAREHDRFLSEVEAESWLRPGNRRRRGR